MHFIDAHCHIDLYKKPSEELLVPEAADVEVLAVTNAPFVFHPCKEIAVEREGVHVAIGLHPQLIERYGGQVNDLIALLGETRFVGEVGLDYSEANQSLRKTQRNVFEKIICACNQQNGIIMSIHSRGAEFDVVSMLKEFSTGVSIFHWYSGAIKYIKEIQERGGYFSVNLSMLSTNKGRKLISRMDRKRVLTESDGPFAIFQKRRLHPRDIPLTVIKLAELWGEDSKVVQEIIQNNWITALGS